MKRILIGRLFHETNTFIEKPTGPEDFVCWKGAELLQSKSDASPMGGVLEALEQAGWEAVPTVDYHASPSGMVVKGVFEEFWTEFEKRARPELERGVDGIYFVLHGAMTCEHLEDAEGEFLSRLRALPGASEVPLFGVLDLHANVTDVMTRHSDGLVLYRENPHTDARESGVRGFKLLQRCLETGVRPRHDFRGTSLVWPPTGTGTTDDPMRALERVARELEMKPGVWEVNVVAGFSHADVRHAGVCFTTITEPGTNVRALLDQMADLAWDLRDQGVPQEWNLNEAIAQAVKVNQFPALLVEPADNIGGGAPGDATSVFRALHEAGESGGVILNDPESVRWLEEFKPGDSVTAALGGKGSRLDPGPFEVTGILEKWFDGRFELEDKQSHAASMHGDFQDMKRCALLTVGGLKVLVTSRKTAPFDLGQWRCAGINPEELRFIGVKAAVAHRRAYDKIMKQSFTVRTPGPCASDLSLLPYQNLRRPVFPLDSEATKTN